MQLTRSCKSTPCKPPLCGEAAHRLNKNAERLQIGPEQKQSFCCKSPPCSPLYSEAVLTKALLLYGASLICKGRRFCTRAQLLFRLRLLRLQIEIEDLQAEQAAHSAFHCRPMRSEAEDRPAVKGAVLANLRFAADKLRVYKTSPLQIYDLQGRLGSTLLSKNCAFFGEAENTATEPSRPCKS